MLRFILGKSGSGKSTETLKIAGELADSNLPVMLIVPDQSTFECEKTLLDVFGAKKAEKVLVFGFSRLCKYVFELTGNSADNVIDEGTRAVVMSLVLEELTEKLRLLSSKGSKSLVDVMLQTVSDLKKSSVTSDELRSASRLVDDETLKTKLNETALITDTFDALVSQSYIDPMDDLTRLNDILQKNNILRNYTIIFDGFSGFTMQQLNVVRSLIRDCTATYFTLTLDPLTDGSEEVFATSQQTYKILKEYAKRDGVDIKAPIKLTDLHRFKNDNLALLEQNIFRTHLEPPEISPENICVYNAVDMYDECEYVARKIKGLVIEKGYLYSDISVICHDIDPYKGILSEILEKYEIPYFSDEHADIDVKPVIRLVNSIFRCIVFDFEREDVLALLKSGLTEFSVEEISLFENYLFVWNVSGSAFKNEFVQNPKGYSDRFSDYDREVLVKVENLRESVIEPLLLFKENAKDKNGLEISKLFYVLLEELKVPDALRRMYADFESSDDKAVGAEQIRIWNMLMSVFDKTAAVIGTKAMTVKRYYELLSLQINAMQLSDIPRTIDCVTVTTAQRVRISKQKASFLIGCVDGIFPAIPHTTGIFSPFELKKLAMNKVEIGDDFAALNNLETFMAYSCMTSASEYLSVSFYLTDISGASYQPSEIVLQCKKVFKNIVAYDRFDFDAKKESMYALRPAFDAVAEMLGRGEKVPESLLEVFSQITEYSAKMDSLKNARDKVPFKINESQNAERLFGGNLSISASQLEKFNLCRFSYFCNYGLNVRERQRAEINPMQYGTIVHYILERFFREYSKEQYSVMDKDELSKIFSTYISEYAAAHFGEVQTKQNSFMYRIKLILENVLRLVKHTIDELTQSEFFVADCELKIGEDVPSYTVVLPDGHKIAVCGSVDRVDIMQKNGTTYLRVIDYKTGSKEFKLSDVLYGINLQMLLYLHSIEVSGSDRYGDIIPAGILYMPATVPYISSDSLKSIDKLPDELNKKLKMNGLLLKDTEIIHGMDKTDAATYIPVKIKAGEPVSSTSLATLEEFGKIFQKVDMLIAEMGKNIYNGNIEARPLKGGHDSCEYCPYDSVCAYRRSNPINCFSVDNKTVIEEITNEINGKEEE
ncbi:PD-(D/E)XK nuclease family protein [Ruminococcus bromii]|uniref:PD-(D/E)XK nuclease family protein n=1 Tax=Ruminococcus bromii TaxID=40518 RepID=UPI003AB58C67